MNNTHLVNSIHLHGRYLHVLSPSLSVSHYTHTTLFIIIIFLGCYLAAVLYSVTHLTGLSVTVSFIISWIISWLIVVYLLLLITTTYTRYTECVSIYSNVHLHVHTLLLLLLFHSPPTVHWNILCATYCC